MASEIVTLKQKIISTDKLIREYKNSKFDCDILVKKNEELTKLIDKLHRDLSGRNSECAKLLGETEPLKKANAKLKQEAEEAYKEAFRCKAEVEANKVYTEQLVEKVKCLEKLEEDAELQTAKNKQLSKLELKMETLKDQLKETKEALAKTRKELKQLQTKHKQLAKYAITFGKVAVSHGKLTVTQKRFYQKLCDGTDGNISDEEGEPVADVSSNLDEENDMQSKMLEELLTSDDVQQGTVTPKSPAKNRKSPRSAQTPHSKSGISSATPSGRVTGSKRGRSKKLNAATPSPEKATVSKEESPKEVPLIESSDTDATVESDHEIAIKGISRIRTRSMSKSISSPDKSLSPANIKREIASMANLLDDDQPEEPAFKAPAATPPLVLSKKRNSRVEEDLSLSSSSDEDDEIDNMMNSIVPKATADPSQQQSPVKDKHIHNEPEMVPDGCKSPPSQSPKAPELECQEMDSDTSSSSSLSPQKVQNTSEAVLSIFDDETSVESPAKPSDVADVLLESTSDSPENRKLPEEIVETVAEDKAADGSDRVEDSEVVNQDTHSGIADFRDDVTVTSTTTKNSEKNDGEISVKELEAMESEPVEATSEEREKLSSTTSEPLINDLNGKASECAEITKKPSELTEEINSNIQKAQATEGAVQDAEIVDKLPEVDLPINIEPTSERVETEPKSIVGEDLPCDVELGSGMVETEAEQIVEAELSSSIESQSDNVETGPEPHSIDNKIGEGVSEEKENTSSKVITVENELKIVPPAPTVIQETPKQDASHVATNEEAMGVEKESKPAKVFNAQFTGTDKDTQSERTHFTKQKATSPATSSSLFEIEEQETVPPASTVVQETEQPEKGVSSPLKKGASNVVANEEVMNVAKESEPTEVIPQQVGSDVTPQCEIQKAQEDQTILSPVGIPESDSIADKEVIKKTPENAKFVSKEDTQREETISTSPKAMSPAKSSSLFEINELDTSPPASTPTQETEQPEEILPSMLKQSAGNVVTNEETANCEKESEPTKVIPQQVNSSPPVIGSPTSFKFKEVNRELTVKTPEKLTSNEKHIQSVDAICTNTKAISPVKSSSLFEIDNPSSTLAEPKTLPAVQVPEIHSSPTKKKSKKLQAKETLNDSNESNQRPEPFHHSSSSAFVSIPSEACNFKVPAVPPLPGQRDQSSVAVSAGKRPRPPEEKDREVCNILREARKLFTDLPRLLSPLPEPPKPKPEPKHAMIPRCAFNWMAKKLPISTELTEQFGAYVKPGVRIRVRFRRVSRRLRDLRASDVLCHLYDGVTNYAEAEKKSQQRVDPNAPLIDESESEGALGLSIARIEASTQATQLHQPSQDVSRNNQKEVPSATSSKTPSPVSEEIHQDVEIEPPIVSHPLERTQSNLQNRNKKQRQAVAPVVPSQTSGRVCEEIQRNVELESTSHAQIQSERVQRTVEQSSFTPRPSLEKRPRLMLDTPEEPVEKLQKAAHNQTLRPINLPSTSRTPTADANLRSSDDLFGSDSNSEDETEQPTLPVQQRILPKMVTRPGLASALVKPKRLQSQPTRPVVTSEPLTRLTPRLEPIAPKPVRPVTIAPCSDAMLSAVSKAKCTPRVVAPRRQMKEPPTPVLPPVLPPINTPERTPDQVYVPLGDLARKRIARAPKRLLEEPSESSDLASPLKKAKTPLEHTPTPSFASTPPPTKDATKTNGSSEAPAITPNIRVRKDVFDTQTEKKINQTVNQPGQQTSMDDESTDEEPLTIYEPPASPTPMETERVRDQQIGSPEESPEESPQSPMSPRAEIESPQSPMSPRAEIESPQSPMSPRAEIESPQSPPRRDLNLPVVLTGKVRVIPHDTSRVTEILTEVPQPVQVASQPSGTLPNPPSHQAAENIPRSAEHLPPYLKELLNVSPETLPTISKCIKKIKITVRQSIDRVCKAEELTDDIFNKSVNGLTLGLVTKHPFIIIRHFVSTVIRACEDDVDLSNTPPLPPLPVVHQRCIALLLTLDEKNREFELDIEKNAHRYSNDFLSEISYTMFRPDTALTVSEMCSLARAYVGLCRAIGDLQRARSFLYDCIYFYPPFSYALAYVIVTLWGEVLRPVTFPTGPSCVDQTIAFLLLFCNSVKAADSAKNRTIAIRTLLQNVYGYKGSTVTTVQVLLDGLMSRLKDTHNGDEAASLSWCLSLIARWQGVSWAINTIQKVLWPFLERWSAGEGTNAGAVAAITSIGLLGKWVPVAQRTGVDRVFGAMKALISSPDVAPPIAEAAIETAILLGSETKAQSVLDILKEWRPKKDVSSHLQNILKVFLKKSLKSKRSLVNDASDENNSASE